MVAKLTKLTKQMKKSDFEATGHKIVMVNDTSSTEISDPEKIKIIEFKAKGCVLRLPINSCAQGHMLTLFILDKKSSLKITGTISKRRVAKAITVICKVNKLQKEGTKKDSQAVIEVEFVEYLKKEWVKVIKTYADQQNRISQLFEKLNR